eukprot:m.27892 g.27892  ORF g.27892 m.27892 type:complete len:391 (+) comp7948_c1_seq2:603-1775(+)
MSITKEIITENQLFESSDILDAAGFLEPCHHDAENLIDYNTKSEMNAKEDDDPATVPTTPTLTATVAAPSMTNRDKRKTIYVGHTMSIPAKQEQHTGGDSAGFGMLIGTPCSPTMRITSFNQPLTGTKIVGPDDVIMGKRIGKQTPSKRSPTPIGKQGPPPSQLKTPVSQNRFCSWSSKKTISPQITRKRREKVSRPLNSFMIFSNERRALLRSEFPEKDNKDISKMLGSQWASLSKADKEIYFERARTLAEQHKIDHPEWKFTRKTKKAKIKGESDESNSDGDNGNGKLKSEPQEYSDPPVTTTKRVKRKRKSSAQPSPLAQDFFSPWSMIATGLSASQAHKFEQLAQMQLKAMIRQQELRHQHQAPEKCTSMSRDPPRYVPPPPIDYH